MKRRYIAVLLAVVALVIVGVVVGFSGGETPEGDANAADDTADAAPADDAPDEEAMPAEEPAPADDGETEASMTTAERSGSAVEQQPAVTDRQLVHTGSVELLVDDVSTVSAEIRDLTVEQGGFVSESTQEVHEAHNETWTTERLVLRVPSDGFDESMSDVEALGEVQAFETETEDVTDQLVDLDARLENLQTERDRLRDLFEDANETRDVLAVQDELSSVQEEIERLDAQKQQLEEQVAYSTITVFLTEAEPEPEEKPEPEEPEWYETSVGNAFFGSVDGLVLGARALVVGVAFALPYALVIGTVAVLAVGLYRYRSTAR